MKSLVLFLSFVFVLSGCHVRLVEGSDSPPSRFVGRRAEVRTKVVVYDRGVFGLLAVPAGEWPASKEEKMTATLEPGASFEVVGVSSRRIESGKHYYLACRCRVAGKEMMFDYPADEKFIGADYISWR